MHEGPAEIEAAVQEIQEDFEDPGQKPGMQI